ncbi:MAG: helix-turn-helix domain-containing protein, partial [Planctomycetota bacterium]
SPNRRRRAYRRAGLGRGRTIREEIERKRLELARQLLANSTHKVSHVARLTGHGSGEQFCRAFARCTGMNPSSFREQQRAR